MDTVTNTDMHEFWSGHGGLKWLRFQEILKKGLSVFGQKAIIAASIDAGNRVLDIGCGCGDTTFDIARLVGKYGHVHGVDISNLILNEVSNSGQCRDEKRYLHNLSFECADVQSHQFEPNIFDVAYSRFGVMFFSNPIAAFTNIRQTLQPDGRLVFICWQSITTNQWVSLALDVVANHISLPPPSNTKEPDAFSFGDPKRVQKILEVAGFIDISIQNYETQFNIGADIDEAVTFLTHMGPASCVIESLEFSSATRGHIITDLFEAIAPYETEDGVNLGAATWIVTARKPGNKDSEFVFR